jgi:DNA gyrase subunit B
MSVINTIQAIPDMFVGPDMSYTAVANVILGIVEHSVLRNCNNRDLKITVVIYPDRVHIRDNGCTLPVVLDESVGLSMAELMLTTKRYSSPNDEMYCLQAAVALSSELSISIRIGKYLYKQSYTDGYPVAPLTYQPGTFSFNTTDTSTYITFTPSEKYFGYEWHGAALNDYLCSEINTLLNPFKGVTVVVESVIRSTVKSGR